MSTSVNGRVSGYVVFLYDSTANELRRATEPHGEPEPVLRLLNTLNDRVQQVGLGNVFLAYVFVVSGQVTRSTWFGLSYAEKTGWKAVGRIAAPKGNVVWTA